MAVKNLIVMVADGAGFNTLEAVRQYLGDPRGGPLGALAVDGAASPPTRNRSTR